jgi:superfamily II DNA or RNA helicase
MAPDYQFHPLYKRHVNGKRIWDGKVRMFDLRSKKLPAGLLRHLDIFAKENGHQVQGFAFTTNNISLAETRKLSADFNLSVGGKPVEAYDHQILAITKALRYKRRVLESSTSSGKSLVAYVLSRHLLNQNKRGLIVVPTIGLVNQMESDFKDYSGLNGWNVEANLHKIFGGQEKDTTKPLVISTWQSIYDLKDKKWFEKFNWIIGDEAHKFSAKSLSHIMEMLTNCEYRIGMTGTVQDGTVPKLTLEGNFGPVSTIMTNKEAMDKGISAELTIKCLVLGYPVHDCMAVHPLDYKEEIDFLVAHKYRNNFIANLVLSLKQNTLILVQYVAMHGKVLYELINQRKIAGRNVYFVHGGTDVEDRELIRGIVEKESNAIIVASYGVFQEGVSIRNLHSIIFASPSKSKIRVLQSIGRGLRISDTKSSATLYDIADDLRFEDESNYALEHYLERMKLYIREQFKVKVYNIALGATT